MPAEFTPPSGVWLPLITPFRDEAIDAASLRRLIGHYAGKPVDGLIVGATTGEGLTLDDAEIEQLVMLTAAAQRDFGLRVPLVLGVSGSDTRKLTKWLARTADWPLDGYLIACPYYTRPSQAGLMLHFEGLADATARPIMIYNIPYRTGVNLGNETMLRLAERSNIVGVKDCCGDTLQTVELLRKRPRGFAVLTGEDALFYGALVRGSDGGILASAHVADRSLRKSPAAYAGRRPAARVGAVAAAFRHSTAVVQRAFAGAAEILAVAVRPDRQPGSAAADDADHRRPRRPARPADFPCKTRALREPAGGRAGMLTLKSQRA